MADNDQNALTTEEQALLDGDAANTGSDAGPVEAKTGTPAKPAADAPAGSDAEGDNKDAPKMVRVEALQESRAEQKALKDELKAEREARLRLEERTNLMLERFAPKEEKPKEPEIPDIDKDPAGHLAAVLARTGTTVEQLLTDSKQRKQEDQNRQAVGNIISFAAAAEREFKAKTPDYDEAGAFMQQSRDAELAALGYTDPNARSAIIQNEKLAIANKAKEDGANPAERVYAMAKLRGYAPKKAEAKVEDDAAKSAERVANIDAGQKTSQSLSDVGGKGPRNLTAAALANMSDAEFAKVMNTAEGKAAMGA